MMRSLNSAVGGLKTHQTKMDVIGNNIANVNTYGFKRSQVVFSDVYYQNVKGSSAPGTTRGGTNPTQIGYGATVATIEVLNTQTGATSTDNAMDVYISGDGFLVTRDADGNELYTRLGALRFDAAGNIVDINGNFVMGVRDLDRFNNDGTANSLQTLNCPVDIYQKLTSINISNTGEISGVLPGDMIFNEADISAIDSWLNILSNENNNYAGNVQIRVGSVAGNLTMSANGAAAPANNFITSIDTTGSLYALRDGNYEIRMYNDPTDGLVLRVWCNEMAAPPAAPVVGWVSEPVAYSQGKNLTFYDAAGEVVMKAKLSTDDLSAYGGATGLLTPDATGVSDYLAITFDLDLYVSGTATYESGKKEEFSEKVVGSRAGVPQGRGTYTVGGATFTIDWPNLLADDDYKYGITSADQLGLGTWATGEGDIYTIGYLVLAKFANNAGLEQAGSSNYYKTNNSGDPAYVRAGSNATGELDAGYLEMSNVDISQEFTDMITTQRGFQANSRIITVSDEMLAELVNLKR